MLENPSVTEVTESLMDSVEHNHMSPRELVESLKGSNVHGTHSSPIGCEDIRPNGVEQTNQTLREVLENPTIDEVSEPLQDGVEQDHVSPWELEESPKGAPEIVTRPSNVKHVDMQEVSAEASKDTVNDRVEVLVGSTVMTSPMVVDGGIPTANSQEVVSLQRQEVHPSKNIQHGLNLWERVREYDARSAVEAAETPDKFMHVLTRNQKQKLKVQQVLSKHPTKSRARDDNQSIDQ